MILDRDNRLCQCQECRALGRLLEATEVDHIKHKAEGGTDDPSNLQAINKDCHKRKTQIEAARYRHRTGEMSYASPYPDWMEPAACPLTIVFGPPASGKRTHIATHAQPWHRVIDLDLILAEVSGLPLYQAPESWLDQAMRIRNTRLGDLRKAQPREATWFSTTASGHRKQWWIDRLQPSHVVVLAEPEGVCVDRIVKDARRALVRDRHVEAVREWWQAERG